MSVQNGFSSLEDVEFEKALRIVYDPLVPQQKSSQAIQFLYEELVSEVKGLVIRKTSFKSKCEVDVDVIADKTMVAFVTYLLKGEHRHPQNRTDAMRLLSRIADRRIRSAKRDFHRKKRFPVKTNGMKGSVTASEKMEFAADYRSGHDPTKNIEEQETLSGWEAKLRKDNLKTVLPLWLGGLTMDEMAMELQVTNRTIGRRIAKIKKLLQDCAPPESRLYQIRTTNNQQPTTDNRQQTTIRTVLKRVSKNFRNSRKTTSCFLSKRSLCS